MAANSDIFFRKKARNLHHTITSSQIAQEIKSRLQKDFGTTPQDAPDAKFYRAAAGCINAIINQKRSDFNEKVRQNAPKQVHYLCMEFLMGRSLKNNLYSLGLTEKFEEALRELGVDPERIYDQEPDAGLGNGGLGRLAACFLDALASGGYAASGYSILYEYGIFRQKIVDGWQTELPDNWLAGGDVWLVPRPDEEVKVQFDGRINDYWSPDGFHVVEYTDYHTVRAVPYDMMVPGYGDSGVAVLRLWSAEPEQFDMTSFNSGDFQTALERSAEAEVISKVLYPSDNHMEGKSLRLRQQYFLVSASTQDIVSKHAAAGFSIDSLPKQAAIHINDTHPALVIPELMRILMDDCGYSWDTAYSITTRTVAYTNHTVMSEALEKWPVDLFSARLPRIWQIVREIDRRYRERLIHARPNDPERFCNVTNGIAYRRWLCQSNPRLTQLLTETIGNGFITDASRLS
ncbi:MAG: glycogen/starch/alpha-glucan phosphorylase, partial [Clostridia bacterium]|nr:glycogen/starch/alpha-glucan phosphorylase [Clostridia bacterium]